MSTRFFSFVMVVLASAALTCQSQAQLIIFDAGPNNDQANLAASAGQTFTTPDAVTLGSNTRMGTVEQWGPIGGAGNFTYGLQLWTKSSNDIAAWDPETLLGTAAVQEILAGETGIFDFTPFNITLNPSTVYALRFVDANGDPVTVRVGMTGNNNSGNDFLGTNLGVAFASGGPVFNPAGSGTFFDVSMRITTVPEPSSLMLLGVCGAAGFLRRRRGLA